VNSSALVIGSWAIKTGAGFRRDRRCQRQGGAP
jgi:hypothetical protein